MEKVRIVYSFNVFDEIEEGKRVYAIDKILVEVFVVNELNVENAVKMIATAKKDASRFEFWVIEEEKEND